MEEYRGGLGTSAKKDLSPRDGERSMLQLSCHFLELIEGTMFHMRYVGDEGSDGLAPCRREVYCVVCPINNPA